jgi:hypothetical protein
VSFIASREKSHLTIPALRLERFAPLIPTLSDLAFLLPILVLFWSTSGVGWLLTDSDTGWHIRTGEAILQNGRVPAVDSFSFTMSGQPWIAWEWLSDVVMALAHHTGGLAGVVYVAMLLLGMTSVVVYKEAVAESSQRLIAISLTSLAMSASTIHWLARPHLVTPLMAAVFCRVLNSVEKKQNPARLWSLPLLTILWANLHGGFFVGIELICTYALGTGAEELLLGSRQNPWVRSRKYLLAAAACALASLVNPYDYRLHIHIAQYLGTSFYFARISEFQSIDFHSFTAAYFETILILAIAAAVWHFHSRRFTHALLLLSWSHLALFSARNIPIFAVVAVPGISVAMREWLDSEMPSCRLKETLREFERGIQLISSQSKGRHLAPCFAVLVLAVFLTHPGYPKVLRAEFDKSRFPVDAAAFLSQQHLASPLRLYSNWQWGGYLIYRLWPSLRVFDDGRTDFYGPRFVNEGLRVWDVHPGWSGILDRYQVNAALLPVDSVLASVMRERDDWKPIYQDGVAVLFAKVEAGKEICTAEGHMSGISEIKVVDAKQVVANASPETTDGNANGSVETAKNNGSYPAIRRRLRDERHSLTHHFSIGGQEGYVTVGLYEDGAPEKCSSGWRKKDRPFLV